MKKLLLIACTLLVVQLLHAQWTPNGASIYYNNGNVGVGTSTPEVRLHVIGESRFTQSGWFSRANNGALAVALELGQVYNADFPAVRIRTADDGGVNEAYWLGTRWGHTVRFQRNGSSGVRTMVQLGGVEGGEHYLSVMADDGTTAKVKLTALGSSYIDGNFGIGSLSPTRRLHLLGSGTNFGQWIENTGTGGSETSRLSFKVAAGGADSRAGVIEWYDGESFKGDLRLLRSGGIQVRNSSDVPVFDVLNNGNIGINTSTPDQRLTIKGGGIGFDGNSADKKLYAPNDGVLEWMTHNSASEHAFAVSHQGEKKVYLNTAGDSYLLGGNLGIGTAAPTSKFHLHTSSPYDGLKITHSGGGGVVRLQANSLQQSAWNGITQQGDAGIIFGDAGGPDALNFGFVIAPWRGGVSGLRISPNGNVSIGTHISDPASRLLVEGTIRTRKVKVDAANWPDYVFAPTYRLPPLKEVEAFIQQYRHLPEVPSAREVEENGLDVGDTQAVLLKKIEELTLYVIELQNQMEKLKAEVKKQNK